MTDARELSDLVRRYVALGDALRRCLGTCDESYRVALTLDLDACERQTERLIDRVQAELCATWVAPQRKAS